MSTPNDQSNPASAIPTYSSAFTPNVAFAGANTAATGAGVCAAANTDYVAVVANANRKFFQIQNTHATAKLTVNVAGPAWASAALIGFVLQPGDVRSWGPVAPNGAIHVASATAGATYQAVEG